MKKKIMISVILLAVLVLSACSSAPSTPPPLSYKPGEYIITNIYGSARLMKLTPVLVFENVPEDAQKPITEYLTLQEPVIRDTIIFVLRAMNEAELREPGVEAVVRDRIMEKLNERLDFSGIEAASKLGVTMESLKTINYYDFVLQ